MGSMWVIWGRPLHRGMQTLGGGGSHVSLGCRKRKRKGGERTRAAKNRDSDALTRQRLIQHPLNPCSTPQMHPTLRKRNSAILCADLISRTVTGTKLEWVREDGFAGVEIVLGF
jgi:hypothetical protein